MAHLKRNEGFFFCTLTRPMMPTIINLFILFSFLLKWAILLYIKFFGGKTWKLSSFFPSPFFLLPSLFLALSNSHSPLAPILVLEADLTTRYIFNCYMIKAEMKKKNIDLEFKHQQLLKFSAIINGLICH